MTHARPCRTCKREIVFERVVTANASHYRPVNANDGTPHRCRRLPRSRHHDIQGQMLLFKDFDRCR